ncbi:MAG: membrane dipeptidase, partial [Chloroflexota bacterium]
NMLCYGRDYTRSAHETRRLEVGSPTVEHNGDSLLGWPEYQAGRVALVFSTLYAPPQRFVTHPSEKYFYRDHDYETAHRIYWRELELYHRLADEHPDKFSLVASRADLKRVLDHWHSPAPDSSDGHPVGLVFLMEGADGIRSPKELPRWYDMGLRHIGLAWAGTRYSGGTKEPGPLTDEGRALLKAMADLNFTLDLSHMDEPAALEALDSYPGPIVVTHANCLALLPGYETNRQLSDRVIRGLIERGGVMGVVPFNNFLKVGWLRTGGSQREEVSLSAVADHIDHICQLAGDTSHAAIGTDFDGGFGLQSVPPEIDTIVDLRKLGDLLQPRGFSDTDLAAIFGENWLRHLNQNLP